MNKKKYEIKFKTFSVWKTAEEIQKDERLRNALKNHYNKDVAYEIMQDTKK